MEDLIELVQSYPRENSDVAVDLLDCSRFRKYFSRLMYQVWWPSNLITAGVVGFYSILFHGFYSMPCTGTRCTIHGECKAGAAVAVGRLCEATMTVCNCPGLAYTCRPFWRRCGGALAP